MTTAIVQHSVDFHGDRLVVIQMDGIEYTPVKPVCEFLGLDWESQRQRIERDEVLTESACVIQAPSVGGLQQMVCLPLDYLNGWLFGVDVGRIRPELRERMILYKRECYRVLAQAFRGGEGTVPLARVEALEERVAKLEGMRVAQAHSHKLLDLTVDDEAHILAHLIITHHRADRLTTTEIAAHLSAQGIDLGASLRV